MSGSTYESSLAVVIHQFMYVDASCQHAHRRTHLPFLLIQADYQDLEKATVLAFKYALETPELLKGLESREAFQNFTDLVALAHPVDRYRSVAP